MDVVYTGLLWESVVIYLDDTNVFSPDFDIHLVHLRQVFERLREAGLKLNIEKCHFGKEKLEFLGHIIAKDGIRPDPSKIEKVKNFPIPENTTELRGFIGLASYYRRFIHRFSEIAKPLNKLLMKGQKYEWKEEQQKAFDFLKNKLITSPILIYPDFNKRFILSTDASYLGLGAVLSQLDDQGKEHVIAYASRALRPPEENYSATEIECLAIIWGIEYFKQYLLSDEFDLFTDHKGLQWLLNKSEPRGWLARWIETYSKFRCNIKYKEGKKNTNADALSRMRQH